MEEYLDEMAENVSPKVAQMLREKSSELKRIVSEKDDIDYWVCDGLSNYI